MALLACVHHLASAVTAGTAPRPAACTPKRAVGGLQVGPCAQETEGAARPQTQVNSQRNVRCQTGQGPNTFTQLTFPGELATRKYLFIFATKDPWSPRASRWDWKDIHQWDSRGCRGTWSSSTALSWLDWEAKAGLVMAPVKG